MYAHTHTCTHVHKYTHVHTHTAFINNKEHHQIYSTTAYTMT